MIATAATLAILWFAGDTLNKLVRRDGAKILAALEGRSWAAEPRPARPATVRFTPTYKAAAPAWPELRAAA